MQLTVITEITDVRSVHYSTQLASVRMCNDDSYVTLLLCYLLQATVYGSRETFIAT
jgi:hypothetical protein